MPFHLSPHSGIPLYRQILQQLRAQIVSGKISAGDQIPSARDLSAELKVNPLTIQKVYQILEQEGLVETRRGIGTFVVPKQKISTTSQKIELLRPHIEQLITESHHLELDPSFLIEEIKKEFLKKSLPKRNL